MSEGYSQSMVLRFYHPFTVIFFPALVPSFLGWSSVDFSTGSGSSCPSIRSGLLCLGTLQERQIPLDHLFLCGLSTGCNVEICSAVVHHGLQGGQPAPLCTSPQVTGKLSSSAWSTSDTW